VPAELIVIYSSGQAYPLARDLLDMSAQEIEKPRQRLSEAQAALKKAQEEGADSARLAKLNRRVEQATKQHDLRERIVEPLRSQTQRYGLRVEELEKLAHTERYASLPVHPVQLYAAIDGLLIAFLLNALFYRRKRHGVLFGLLMLLYPLCRIAEEMIRIDNPHDTAGLTVSQFVSVMGITIGIVWLVAIYRLPLRSPRAVPFVWPPPEPASNKRPRKGR